MRAGIAAGLWASTLLSTPAWPAGGQGVAAPGFDLQHRAVGCVVAGSFARLEACTRPPAGRTLAYFRARGTGAWYYVQLAPRGDAEGCVAGVLPKPQRRTNAIEYYLEATSPALASVRSEEFTAAVVGSAAECGERPVALGASTAAVVVTAPPGAPAVPAGFSTAGIVGATPSAVASAPAAGGGLSGSTLAIVGAGVAAAGGVALAVGSGGSGDGTPSATGVPSGGGSPATTTTTTTSTLPAAVLSFVSGSPPPGSNVPDPGGSFTLALTVTVSVQCAADVANARLFVTLRRGASLCATSYADIPGLSAGVARTLAVSGFVVAADCRPAPFTTDSAWMRVYDMARSPTTPLGEAFAAVSYNIVR